MMKRIMAVGVLAMMVAASAQGQNSGLMAAGSNFTGPGGGGGGATGTIGAFLPGNGGLSMVTTSGGGLPFFGGGAGFATATAPATVTIGSGANSISVTVSASDQQAAAGPIISAANISAFVSSLTGVPGVQAQALGNALSTLGNAIRSVTGGRSSISYPQTRAAITAAIDAFNAATSSLPAGSPVPGSLVAARALIAGYYVR